MLLHRKWTLLTLGLIGALVGAIMGRQSGRRLYRSEGLIRVPFVRTGSDPQAQSAETAAELFEAFLQSQRAVLGSRRLTELAMRQPEWVAAVPSNASQKDPAQDFSQHLLVEHAPRTDYLTIAYTDRNPALTAAAVRSVTSAYSEIFSQQSQEFLQQQTELIEARKSVLTAQMDGLDQSIAAAAGSAGIASANLLYDSAVQRVVKLQDSLSQLRVQMAMSDTEDGLRSHNKVQALRAAEPALHKLLDDARAEMQALGEKRLTLDRLTSLRDPLQKELADEENRLYEMKSQFGAAGAVTVVSDGETPLQPYQDRQWTFTLAGAGAGAILPAGLFVLVTLAASRYHFWGQAEIGMSSEAPFLGVLPEISGDSALDSDDAARCLHQIRVMLQSCRGQQGQPVSFLVSSCSQGEGKTSVATALAMSFATSGSRTLLIDFDLTGRAMTSRFGLKGRDGLKEAMDTRSLLPYCTPLALPNLSILPVGKASSNDAAAIAGESVQFIIRQAKASFDIVLIDSGPVLGSVETSLVAPRVDGVIFTVARDQKRSLIDLSLQKLRTMRSPIAGVIFNRAKAIDFRRSSHSSYSSRKPEKSVITADRGPRYSTLLNGLSEVGPLVNAVALSLPGQPEAASINGNDAN